MNEPVGTVRIVSAAIANSMWASLVTYSGNAIAIAISIGSGLGSATVSALGFEIVSSAKTVALDSVSSAPSAIVCSDSDFVSVAVGRSASVAGAAARRRAVAIAPFDVVSFVAPSAVPRGGKYEMNVLFGQNTSLSYHFFL